MSVICNTSPSKFYESQVSLVHSRIMLALVKAAPANAARSSGGAQVTRNRLTNLRGTGWDGAGSQRSGRAWCLHQ